MARNADATGPALRVSERKTSPHVHSALVRQDPPRTESATGGSCRRVEGTTDRVLGSHHQPDPDLYSCVTADSEAERLPPDPCSDRADPAVFPHAGGGLYRGEANDVEKVDSAGPRLIEYKQIEPGSFRSGGILLALPNRVAMPHALDFASGSAFETTMPAPWSAASTPADTSTQRGFRP